MLEHANAAGRQGEAVEHAGLRRHLRLPDEMFLVRHHYGGDNQLQFVRFQSYLLRSGFNHPEVSGREPTGGVGAERLVSGADKHYLAALYTVLTHLGEALKGVYSDVAPVQDVAKFVSDNDQALVSRLELGAGQEVLQDVDQVVLAIGELVAHHSLIQTTEIAQGFLAELGEVVFESLQGPSGMAGCQLGLEIGKRTAWSTFTFAVLPAFDLADGLLVMGVQPGLLHLLPLHRRLDCSQNHAVKIVTDAIFAQCHQVAALSPQVAQRFGAIRIALPPVVEEGSHLRIVRFEGKIIGQHQTEV